MSVIPYTIPVSPHNTGQKYMIVKWSNLAAGDTGTPFELANFADRAVQITGTFGSCTIEGTIDGTNYFTLRDVLGNSLTFTVTGGKQIMEIVRAIRPNVTGVGADLTVTMLVASKN